jgi:hypothetical protein
MTTYIASYLSEISHRTKVLDNTLDGASPSHKVGLLLYGHCSCQTGEKYEDGKISPVYMFTLDSRNEQTHVTL